MRVVRLLLAMFLLVPFACAHAQEVKAAPGAFDFYLLDLSWAPEFCHNVQVLPENEHTAKTRADSADECGTPHGFVLHGLWPQNFAGTWPGFCSDRPGPASYQPYLAITPSLILLQHEWAKHGTCTTLAPDTFFQTADKAFLALQTPPLLQHTDHALQLKPDDVLGAFYTANPGYPQGSLSLSCGHNYLTAVEACLDKTTLKPIACQGVQSCGATVVKVAPEMKAAQ